MKTTIEWKKWAEERPKKPGFRLLLIVGESNIPTIGQAFVTGTEEKIYNHRIIAWSENYDPIDLVEKLEIEYGNK